MIFVKLFGYDQILALKSRIDDSNGKELLAIDGVEVSRIFSLKSTETIVELCQLDLSYSKEIKPADVSMDEVKSEEMPGMPNFVQAETVQETLRMLVFATDSQVSLLSTDDGIGLRSLCEVRASSAKGKITHLKVHANTILVAT
jgi:hypothetical protein